MDAVENLVKWFKAEFKRRTILRGQVIHYALPGDRISWHEVVAKAKWLEVKQADDASTFRLWFQDLFERRLRRSCTRIMLDLGEGKSFPPLNEVSKVNLAQYRAGGG
jgi:hypothetical protein